MRKGVTWGSTIRWGGPVKSYGHPYSYTNGEPRTYSWSFPTIWQWIDSMLGKDYSMWWCNAQQIGKLASLCTCAVYTAVGWTAIKKSFWKCLFKGLLFRVSVSKLLYCMCCSFLTVLYGVWIISGMGPKKYEHNLMKRNMLWAVGRGCWVEGSPAPF